MQDPRSRRTLILLIAVLALAMRLPGLFAPLTDHHYWRQLDTAAIARNFATENMNLLYPMLDWQGPRGYAEVEFQLYTWLVAVLYRMFGVHDFLGRVVSILCSLGAMFVLYDLARRALGTRAALWAALLVATAPLPVFFGRSFQPEAMMAFFSVAAIYCVYRYVERDGERWFWLGAAATSLAILLKLPSLYLGLPLVALALRPGGVRFLAQPRWWVFAALALAPSLFWYSWAHELGVASSAGFSIVGSDGTHRLFPFHFYGTSHFWLTLARRWFQDCLALYGAPLAAWGAVVLLRRGGAAWLWTWLVAFLIYQFGAALGHLTHDYYSLPLVYPLALVFGAGAADLFARLPRRWTTPAAVLMTALLAAGSWCYMRHPLDPWYGEIYAMRGEALQLGELAPPGALLAINDDLEHLPAPFYFADRKGWHETNFIEWRADLRDWVERTRAMGATYYAAFLEAEGNNPLDFLASPTGRYVARRYRLVHAGPRLIVADLTEQVHEGRHPNLLPAEADVAWLSSRTAVHPPEAWRQRTLEDKPRYVMFGIYDAGALRASPELSRILSPSSEYGFREARAGLVVMERGRGAERNADVARALRSAEVYEVGKLPCYTGQPVFDIESPLMYAWECRTATGDFQDIGVLRVHDLLPGRYTTTYFVRCLSPGIAGDVAGVVLQTQPDRQMISGERFEGNEWNSATDYQRLSYTFDYPGGASPEVVLQFLDHADIFAHSLLFHAALPEPVESFTWPAELLSATAEGKKDEAGRVVGVGRGKREGLILDQLLRLPVGRYQVTLDLEVADPPPGALGWLELSHEGQRLAREPFGAAPVLGVTVPERGSVRLRVWDYGQASLRITGMEVARQP